MIFRRSGKHLNHRSVYKIHDDGESAQATLSCEDYN